MCVTFLKKYLMFELACILCCQIVQMNCTVVVTWATAWWVEEFSSTWSTHREKCHFVHSVRWEIMDLVKQSRRILKVNTWTRISTLLLFLPTEADFRWDTGSHAHVSAKLPESRSGNLSQWQRKGHRQQNKEKKTCSRKKINQKHKRWVERRSKLAKNQRVQSVNACQSKVRTGCVRSSGVSAFFWSLCNCVKAWQCLLCESPVSLPAEGNLWWVLC